MSIRVSHHVTPEGLVCLTAHLPCGRVVRVVGEPGDETGRAFEGICCTRARARSWPS